MATQKKCSAAEEKKLLEALYHRFLQHMHRHESIHWDSIMKRLQDHPEKLWSIHQMERTEGEPDVVDFNRKTGEYIFMDCSLQSPAGRRSLCFDAAALAARKEHKPSGSAVAMAHDMGIELLDEAHYRFLQNLGPFDTKTSSWIVTPPDIRKMGGALFADYRYGHVFVYHNGAESYYAARGFRGLLRV